MDDFDEDENPASWHRHPITQKAVRVWAGRQEAALCELLTECSQSIDARVSAAHSRYAAITEMVAYFKPKGASK